MERTDFYKAMGIKYDIVTTTTTVTDGGNIRDSVIVGTALTVATSGHGLVTGAVAGAAGALGTGYLAKHPGEYKTVSTVAYVQSASRPDTYDTIVTVEIFYKAPEYDYYAEKPILTKTFYGGLYVN